MFANSWHGVGRLTNDAVMSSTKKSDIPMARFRMAVNDTGTSDVLFLTVICFGKLAERTCTHLVKGREVYIQGKLKVDTFENEAGVKQQTICVMADNLSFGRPRVDKD